jgi:CHAD domain-containing protein
LLAIAVRSVDVTIADPHPSVEGLHRLHRELRRLRLAVDLWSRLLPAKYRELARALTGRVRRLARLVGEVRDRDVVLALFDRVADRAADPEETRQFHRVLGRLRDDARTGRELLRASFRTERDAHLFDAIDGVLNLRPTPLAAQQLRRLLGEEHQAHHERVRRAHRRASHRPSAARLHRLRIRLRQLRHLAELAQTVDPGVGPRIPVAFRRLQDLLGRLHDLDIAIATLDPELDRTPWADQLRSIRRRTRREARTSLERLATSPNRSASSGRLVGSGGG